MAAVHLERAGSAEPDPEGVRAGDDPASLPTERLEAEVRSLATRIAAATCRWLLMVAELDRREAYAHWECRSTAAWLSWQCSMSSRTANEHVRVARALEHLPTIRSMFGAGELSYSKVRALTRVADPQSEAELATVARSLTAAMLDETCGSVARTHREVDLGRDAAQQARRGVHFHEHDDGTVTITARVAPDVAELVGDVVDRLLDELPDDEPGTSLPARRADALELAFLHLATGAGSGDRDERDALPPLRTEVVVHADVETLVEREPGRCRTQSGRGLTVETVRRLACDGGLRLSLERDGRTFDVGRRTRRAAAALRRKSMASHDHRCAFPGCNSTRHLQLHHIRSWLDGGPTDAENLLPLCHFHHRAVHERGWRITVRVDGTVIATSPGGRTLDPLPTVEATEPRLLALPRTTSPSGVMSQWGAGETSRREACVDGFLNATRPPGSAEPGTRPITPVAGRGTRARRAGPPHGTSP